MSYDEHQQTSHHANFQFDVHLGNNQIVNPNPSINTTSGNNFLFILVFYTK